MISVNGYRQDKVLTIAAALEARSEHPLAGAILAKASPGEEASDVEAVPGNGLVGRLASEEVRLGRPGFIGTRSLDDDVVRLQDAGATVVLVERSGVLVGAVGVRDELRREVPGVVLALKDPPLRIAEIVMLTGDNRRTATALAESAGIDEVAAELLPEDKARAIEELQQRHHAAMVGDSINDAPALATASVGIAMGRWAATSPTKRRMSHSWAKISITFPRRCITLEDLWASCARTSPCPPLFFLFLSPWLARSDGVGGRGRRSRARGGRRNRKRPESGPLVPRPRSKLGGL